MRRRNRSPLITVSPGGGSAAGLFVQPWQLSFCLWVPLDSVYFPNRCFFFFGSAAVLFVRYPGNYHYAFGYRSIRFLFRTVAFSFSAVPPDYWCTTLAVIVMPLGAARFSSFIEPCKLIISLFRKLGILSDGKDTQYGKLFFQKPQRGKRPFAVGSG